MMPDEALCIVVAGLKVTRHRGRAPTIESVAFGESCEWSDCAEVMDRAMRETGEVMASCYRLDNPEYVAKLCHLGWLALESATDGAPA